MISDALVLSESKRTLVNLLYASKSVRVLCLPSLMRSIKLSDDEDFTIVKVAAFALDGLGTGKFSLVKDLSVDYTIAWMDDLSSLRAIWDGLENLENLQCLTSEVNSGHATLLWSLLLRKPQLPRLRKITFWGPSPSDYVLDGSPVPEYSELPETITVVLIRLFGDDEQQLYFLRTLDRLPNLQHIRWDVSQGNLVLLKQFPNLVRRSQLLMVKWPVQTELLSMASALVDLFVVLDYDEEITDLEKAQFWAVLRGMPSLEHLFLNSFSTSILLGLSSTPEIKFVDMFNPRWDLNEPGKDIVRALKGVKIKIKGYERPMSHDEEEFWKSFPWVELVNR